MIQFADAAMSNNGGNLYQTGIMIAVALLFFYFILWRPEQKRRKAMEERRNSMSKGDKVTAMGIIGTIVEMSEETVTVETAGSTRIEMLKPAVTEVHKETAKASS